MILLYLLFFFLSDLSNVYAAHGSSQVTSVEQPFEVPELPFFDQDDEKVYLDQFENKTVLLVFWATWCSACTQEMPDLDLLQKDFRKLPFEVIALSQDFNGIKAVQNYFKSNEIRHLKIYHDRKNQLFDAFGVIGLPSAFLINSDGKVMLSFRGNINWHQDKIRDTILSYIQGEHAEPKNSYKPDHINQFNNKTAKQINKEKSDEKK